MKKGLFHYSNSLICLKCIDRLSQIDPGLSQNVHSTRLKNKLLEHIPGLQAQTHGQQVLLMFNEDISETINIAISHVTHQDAIHLVRAAQIIRNDLQKVKFDFDGSFKECNVELVPQTLRTLINMIMEGPDIKNNHVQIRGSKILQIIVLN